jgi:hypothetical protein
MRVFKTKLFSRRAKDMGLDDNVLFNAAKELSQGAYEANLGGNIYKKRIALGNRGKSGGARTIVAFKIKDKAIFLYGFPKNERGNITQKEEAALKGLAEVFLSYSDYQIDGAIKTGDLIEVYDEQSH